MPSNQEYKGKDIKGRSYDEPSGVGTSSAGMTGTTGNLNDGGRDGGVGTPDDGDAGNRQSAGHGQPGGTPALGSSQRGPARDHGRQDDSDLASGPGDNSQRGHDANQGKRQSGSDSRQGGGGSPDDSDMGTGGARQG